MLFEKIEEAQVIIKNSIECMNLKEANDKVISLKDELNTILTLQKSVLNKQECLKKRQVEIDAELDIKEYSRLLKDIKSKLEMGEVSTKSITYDMKKAFRDQEKKLNGIWQKYAQAATDELRSSLEVTVNISDKKQELQYIIRSINALRKSDFEEENSFKKIDELVEQGTAAISGLGLTKEIESFLRKIMNGKATISDLSADTLGWIQKNDLQKVIKIGFM